MERSIKIQIGQHYYPQEIVEDILSRLPVNSLLKFRCVSIFWRSLIDSEEFIKIHLKKSTENKILSHHRIILNPALPRDNDRILKMCSWSSLLKEPLYNPVEFDNGKYISREVNIVGCCDGLVCLVQDRGTFILWNPATRMCLHLPDAHTSLVGEAKFAMYGFGYDDSTNDYKVFVIMTPDKRRRIGKVYSLKRHSWKTLEEKDFPRGRVKSGMFVSGNLHWIEEMKLYSFDLKNEAFGRVEQAYYKYFVPTQTLGVIDGCLSVLCDYTFDREVWVMKEYGVKESWINLFTILNSEYNPCRRALRLHVVHSFCTGPNRELLLIYDSTLSINRYNPDDDKFHCSVLISIDKVMGEGFYVESLTSLGPNAGEERF